MRKENLLEDTERERLEDGENGECLNQHVRDQARGIRKNAWLSELELEEIKRQVEDESQGNICREHDKTADAETVENDVETVEE